MINGLITLTAISCALGFLAIMPIRNYLISTKSSLRGFIKHYNAGKYSPEINKLIKRWFISVGVNFGLIYILVIFLTWKTDYNFFIALYPFFWHYVFFRFFLWEKEDIT